MNRYFADESLPAREAAALRAFARRDPKTWRGLALNIGIVALGVAWAYLSAPARQNPRFADDAAVIAATVFVGLALGMYAWWEWSLHLRARRIVSRQAEVGALLTSSFGQRALRVTTPDISYEIPYSSITHVVRIADVLVVKPRNHLVLALPMELVPPQDLALITSKVANRPMREASFS